MKRQRTTAGKMAERRGAMMPVVAFMMPLIMIFVGYSINIACIELAQTELRLSCDSAAKAALVNFGVTQAKTTATNFGKSVAASNTVYGQTISIPSGNFQYGNATKQANGSYLFTLNGTPMNSVQVTGTATIALPFGAMIPTGNYTCSEVSFATRISHDIVLVLDRSASMSFDLSGNQFVYPTDRTQYSPLQSYFTSPSPTASRWAALNSAVNSFIAVLQARNLDVKLGLVTYAEAYTLGNYSATQASLDVQMSTNFTGVQSRMTAWGATPLLGDTNIAAGLTLAQGELTSSRARLTADRTIILLTDGVVTTGNTDIPGMTSTYRTGSSIVTHVITFGGEAATGSVQTSMVNAAQNGNGMFFNAATAAQLQTAFQKIADSLPAVLVK